MQDFMAACSCLHKNVNQILMKIPDEIKISATEIILRKNNALYLICKSRIIFISKDGSVVDRFYEAYVVNEEEINDSILRACGFAVFAHKDELLHGFISIGNGCRMTLIGEYGNTNGTYTDFSCIDGIRIRICHQILIDTSFVYADDHISSVLIVGPPASGKTTMLRSLATNLAGGQILPFYSVSVIDERNELFPKGMQRPVCADVISGVHKAIGINMAVRLCSPQIVICDEIGTIEESEAIKNCLNSGIIFICSMHALNENELYRRECFKELQAASVFEKIVLLNSATTPGSVRKIISFKENSLA